MWPRRVWSSGYAKLIRDHPCSGGYVPQRTTHRTIHEFVGEIYCPSDKQCKKAYIKLCSYYHDDLVRECDNIETKLEILIKCFKKSKRTVRDLEKQLEVIREHKGG